MYFNSTLLHIQMNWLPRINRVYGFENIRKIVMVAMKRQRRTKFYWLRVYWANERASNEGTGGKRERIRLNALFQMYISSMLTNHIAIAAIFYSHSLGFPAWPHNAQFLLSSLLDGCNWMMCECMHACAWCICFYNEKKFTQKTQN